MKICPDKVHFKKQNDLLYGGVRLLFLMKVLWWKFVQTRCTLRSRMTCYRAVLCSSLAFPFITLYQLSQHTINHGKGYKCHTNTSARTVVLELMTESLHLVMAPWIQYKQHLWNKVTFPWELDRPRTYSYPWRYSYHNTNSVSWFKKESRKQPSTN